MNLASAAGIRIGERVAFVGAGGKTSSIFTLARELPPPVLITTTTHLGAWQSNLADEHLVIHSRGDLRATYFHESRESILVTGPEDGSQRLSGLDDKSLEKLRTIAKDRHYTLLIEADGARQRPLKAPAAHEPRIPPWVDQVIVVAGMGGLGKPLTNDWVHRPEIFSKIADLSMGERIQVEHLVRVLRSVQGGCKGIPMNSSRILFLNQAEGAVLKAKAARIAEDLSSTYRRVVIGTIDQAGQRSSVFSARSRIAGVILAAGGSERFGTPKQVLKWRGEPFIRHMALNALEAGLSPLMAVTGANRELIEASICDLPLKIVQNPAWETGQSSSMQAGLKALPPDCEGVIFLLADQPQVSPILIRRLIERFWENRSLVTAPLTDSGRANPVLFDKETFSALMDVEGDRGGRAILNKFQVDWLPWVDGRISLDVDKPRDYKRLIQAYFPELES